MAVRNFFHLAPPDGLDHEEPVEILFVAGDPDLAELYRMKLELDGYRVTIVSSVEEAIDRFRRSPNGSTPACPPTSAAPAACNMPPARSRRRIARSARTSVNTCRRRGSGGRRCRSCRRKAAVRRSASSNPDWPGSARI